MHNKIGPTAQLLVLEFQNMKAMKQACTINTSARKTKQK